MKMLLYNLKKSVFARNRLVRIIQTNNYQSKKLAIGESNDDKFPKDWIKVNQSNADINIDLNGVYKLPFKDNAIDLIYSAHCLEHLIEEKSQDILNECFRVMKPGASIRIEVPDASKIIACYKNREPEYLAHFDKRYTQLVEQYAYPRSFLEEHVGMMGIISNYFDDSLNFQIPVYATKEECDDRLRNTTLDEFCAWCISLQTPKQFETAGHKTFFYFEKLKKKLSLAGFKNISKLSFNKSNSENFQLSKGKKGITEKSHRRFYSLYVEAEK